VVDLEYDINRKGVIKMKTENRDVKSEGKVIGNIIVYIYDNFEEADKYLGLDDNGKSVALKLLNRQAIIRQMDKFRTTQEMGGLSMADIRAKAKDDPALLAKIKALLG